jgi:hypothetical protein
MDVGALTILGTSAPTDCKSRMMVTLALRREQQEQLESKHYEN